MAVHKQVIKEQVRVRQYLNKSLRSRLGLGLWGSNPGPFDFEANPLTSGLPIPTLPYPAPI